jgi:hypothetical protein
VEQLLVLLVGELRVGDAQSPPEVIAAEFVETAVGLGVDARDEEAGDRVDAAQVAAGGNQPLEASQIGLDHLTVTRQRERSE